LTACVGGDEDGVPFAQLELLPFDVERSSALEDGVDLVVGVQLLMIGLSERARDSRTRRRGAERPSPVK
jgi:hypothetical protein